MRISLIVAMDLEGVIGQEKGLPWRLPADLKNFRKITWGK
ncbi:MAG: dihydrofolate reductase, partial [Planctomycetota bacterium]